MPASTVPIPNLFRDRMSCLLGGDYPAFVAALDGAPRRGLRVNTLKLPVEAFRCLSPFPLGEGVPWCPQAFHLEADGTEPGKHPFHAAGLYYLQDPSAMSAAALLGPEPGERILDLAAAPGGKTTHLASLMQGRGLLVANEIKTSRLSPLVVNIERWGAPNVVAINETPERLADKFGAAFDRVLVDAPCSGEGTFCRDRAARRDWSLQAVADYAAKQITILRIAAQLVRPGGSLLYSTCTFAPEEDEGTIAAFLHVRPDFEVVPLTQLPGFLPGQPEWLPTKDAMDTLIQTTGGAVRLLPHRVRGDGHFVCRLRRGDGPADDRSAPLTPVPLPPGLEATWRAFRGESLAVDFPGERLHLQGARLYLLPEAGLDLRGLRVAVPGVWLGTFKKERFEPAHALALTLRRDEARCTLDLPAEGRDAASYLRGETLASDGAPGWTLVCADGFPLGWGKRVRGRLKNHYPRGWVVGS